VKYSFLIMKSHYTHPSKPVHQFTPFLSGAPFMNLKEAVSHSLVFKTTGILEQPSNTSLLQSIF